MKKNFLLSCLLLLLGSTLHALPVGNPAEPALLKRGVFFDGPCPEDPCFSGCNCLDFRAGFYGDYVFNRRLRVDEPTLHKIIEETTLYTNAAYLAVGFCDRLEVYSTLGSTSAKLRGNITAFSQIGFDPKGQHMEVVSATEFSWSVGLRAILWQCGCFIVGAQTQYFRANPHIIRIVEETSSANYPSNVRMRYHEWQVGLGIAYNVCNIAFPYVAVNGAYSRARFHHAFIPLPPADSGDAVILNNLINEQKWGYAIGISFVICCNTSINIEGRFAGERACSVNGQFRF